MFKGLQSIWSSFYVGKYYSRKEGKNNCGFYYRTPISQII